MSAYKMGAQHNLLINDLVMISCSSLILTVFFNSGWPRPELGLSETWNSQLGTQVSQTNIYILKLYSENKCPALELIFITLQSLPNLGQVWEQGVKNQNLHIAIIFIKQMPGLLEEFS